MDTLTLKVDIYPYLYNAFFVKNCKIFQRIWLKYNHPVPGAHLGLVGIAVITTQ
jgi:hypothetical protein